MPVPATWARQEEDGYARLAEKVAVLLERCPPIARMLAVRYPVVICDEHQDASFPQHAIVMALHRAGAHLRVFGDPMQALFDDGDHPPVEQRWKELQTEGRCETLGDPHRWNKAPSLGNWILAARETLRQGAAIDLAAALPPEVEVVLADRLDKKWGSYRLNQADRAPIDLATRTEESLLILAAHTATVGALLPFFNGRFPIWEGHVRDELAKLAAALGKSSGNAIRTTEATLRFVKTVCTGFSPSQFGNTLLSEVKRGCTPARKGKPAALQELGRLLIEEPDHRGVANFLRRLAEFTKKDPSFKKVRIDYPREFRDAVALGEFDDVNLAVTEIARRRTVRRPAPPKRAISTVHKAKGLERSRIILLPCDAKHFPDTLKARRLLYVALSRATAKLMIVVSPSERSPLVKI